MDHRGTFVGTPLYASPEMLSNSVSGPFTDLWALGVIVYFIVTGEPPWRGNQEYAVFKQILERHIIFPTTMPIDAVDLVDKLLQLNPLKRLGAGKEGTDLDFKSLKAHPFFKNLNFDRISNGSIAPPIPESMFEKAIEISKEEHKDAYE